MSEKTVVVIGGGPAGLTAAYEMSRTSGIRVVLLEASEAFGGISRTVNHKGNRIDIGGHRFFSKSDWVMNWWKDIMPVGSDAPGEVEVSYQNKSRMVEAGAATDADNVMLVRNRLSRIYFEGKFLSYPVKPDVETALKLGPAKMAKIGATYAQARLFPRHPEASLEDFLMNRFGSELYKTFFEDYTEKVWGVPCDVISADWGAQRIKGLSLSKALKNAAMAPVRKLTGGQTKNTSLIEKFLYPKYGPGQLWERVAELSTRAGVDIRTGQKAVQIHSENGSATAVVAADAKTGERHEIKADYVLSTMPVSKLIGALGPAAPQNVQDVAFALEYRDFITVGLLLKKLKPTAGAIPGSATNLVPDNWIYVQDRGVHVGRLQIFNNWSPHMVADPDTVWVGMEFFCRQHDGLWSMDNEDLTALAIKELGQIGLADQSDLLDSTVLRVEKAYPGYFGAYDRFDEIRSYTDSLDNLFLIGRNGMHRYNNQDHSMLTAKLAAEAVVQGIQDKQALWDVNIDDDYHEEKAA